MARRGLSLQEMFDFIQELDEAEDQNQLCDIPTTIYIEPPVDGNESGEDDAEDDCAGIPDNVCSAQLRGGCEVVMASGRRMQGFDEEEDMGGMFRHDTIAVKWQDVKEVMLLSDCHTSEMCTVRRKMKDGTEAEFPCPDIVKTYRAIMGGVDLADQMSGLYDISRKSNKWWKKVFYRGMMMAAVNTWVIYSELNRKKPDFLPVLVETAESLIEKGNESTAYKRSRRSGR
ncbi:uncharacterized protein LOC129242016 [Anastrepha obliqua]|uniref:uncharacterized protein LOC129242016 n=1 Tax=Anastrepha obliqua TaxID=95512 RepID=UPI002409DDDA|nr:uncharacterized protein LOC129242016 [Anastrepha obliqua]